VPLRRSLGKFEQRAKTFEDKDGNELTPKNPCPSVFIRG
jgi:hypothetical protein